MRYDRTPEEQQERAKELNAQTGEIRYHATGESLNDFENEELICCDCEHELEEAAEIAASGEELPDCPYCGPTVWDSIRPLTAA